MYCSEKRKCEIDIFRFCIIFISPKKSCGHCKVHHIFEIEIVYLPVVR